jgi:Zn-dependent protease
MLFVPLVLSLSVHEWAHAYSAYRLGDDTAARQGRMTLSPIAHLDFWGTVVAPLMHLPFGWAKPVPVVPSRFRRDISMGTGTLITAAAGPVSNLVLAVLCAVVYGTMMRFGVGAGGPRMLCMYAIQINLGLFVFNFLPIPPLDGSRVVDGFVPYRYRDVWERFTQYSWIVFLVVILFGSSYLQGPIAWLGAYLDRVIAMAAGV